jgi:predicted membrane-bound spermidine synthase
MAWFFFFFAISGFCSLIYEVAWLRLAMAGFGVTTPMVSIVLSLFMAGLGIGSVVAGRLSRRFGSAGGAGRALRTYALAEATIGVSSVLVPLGLSSGSALLGSLGTSWGSSIHYLLAGIVVALCMLPFGVCMGATLPLAMASMRRLYGGGAQRSFSFLYLANLVGATLGTLGSAFVLIEVLGFRGTLRVAGFLNLLLAMSAYWLSLRLDGEEAPEEMAADVESSPPKGASLGLVWLFLTGLCSMAMEVVWTRLYTRYLSTLVYAFAGILAIYLACTYAGSQLYKAWGRRQKDDGGSLWLFLLALVAVLALLPLWASDPGVVMRQSFKGGLRRVLFGIGPFSAVLGFLTPLIVDRHARGSARRAGSAYAINVVGCIVGPLVAGFVLLPHFHERTSLMLLALPLLAAAVYTIAAERKPVALVAVILSLLPIWLLMDKTHTLYDTIGEPKQTRRDYTATTVAWGAGMDKHLWVNGIGMTTLTPVTKVMVHLPLALHDGPPKKALVICFGMGTSYRAALSWGIDTTAVELVPSIPSLMPFFHADGAEILHAPNGKIVIDDGRRFLEREVAQYDLVVIDPPPPVEAAGSSLLYSTEMYDAVKRRLAPNGIVQQWFPTDDADVLSAVSRALKASFPYVYPFHSFDNWGYHFFCSQSPIRFASAAELAQRMPEAARHDLVEWGPLTTPEGMLDEVLRRPLSLEALIQGFPIGTLRDDHPVNEYYLLRRGHF